MKKYKEMLIVLHSLNEVEIIKVKREISNDNSVIFFNADKKYLKHLDSVKRVFFNHCNAEYLIVFTSDENIYNGLKEIHSNISAKTINSINDFVKIIKGGG